jgi:hypothetical protein
MDLVAYVVANLNGISTKFTMGIDHAKWNAHRQFRKPVIKVRLGAW